MPPQGSFHFNYHEQHGELEKYLELFGSNIFTQIIWIKYRLKLVGSNLVSIARLARDLFFPEHDLQVLLWMATG